MEFDWNNPPFEFGSLTQREIEESFEDAFAVRHLRHSFRRNETYRVDMTEARGYQSAQILDLPLRRNLMGETLPRVARAFDELD